MALRCSSYNPGGKILAVQCDNTKGKEFQCASKSLELLLGDCRAKTVHDTGSDLPRECATGVVEVIRTCLDSMVVAGIKWANNYWQVLEAPCGTMAVGLGANLKNGKGTRPRAAKLALALTLFLNDPPPPGTIVFDYSFCSVISRARALLRSKKKINIGRQDGEATENTKR